MNSKIIVPIAVIGAILFLGGKKKSPTSDVVEDEIFDGEEQEDYEEPKPAPKPAPKPKTDDKWKKLNSSRRKIADLYISDTPLVTPPTNLWDKLDIGSYEKWSQGSNNSYYDWLTNQVYWDITVNKEDTTDIYTMIGATHPFYLRKGQKAEATLKDGEWIDFKEVELDETSSDADKRLKQGRELWLQIQSYIKKNLNPIECPPSAVCE